MAYYTIDILTPDKVVVSGVHADNFLIPTEGGEINVLPEHTHIMSKLSTGMLTIVGAEGSNDRCFSVSSGICKILGNKVMILSSICEEIFEIDVERSKVSLKEAQEKLQKTDLLADEDIKFYQDKLDRAMLRIKMANSNKPS